MAESGVKPKFVDGSFRDEEAQKKFRESMDPIDRQYEAQQSIPRRIHFVGTGSIGKLVAHALRSVPDPPPVTLLLHRYDLFKAWRKGKKVITVKEGEVEIPQGGYDVELLQWGTRQHGVVIENTKRDAYALAEQSGMKPHEAAKVLAVGQEQKQEPLPDEEEGGNDEDDPSEDQIDNLIIATKAIRTVAALSAIKHRLSRSSTICFLQNGMGIIDELNKKVFTDESTRPNYIQGIITHGANMPLEKANSDPFYVVHAGKGTIALGLIPRQTPSPSTSTPADQPQTTDVSCPDSARYIFRTLTRCPSLCAVAFTPSELLQQQLEKLAVNSVLNPLTALMDNRNGHILYNFALSRTMRLMLAETCTVIRNLPELQGIPNLASRFDAHRLETLVVSVADKTAENISSMLADIRAGRKTEIEYINGYLIRRGEEVGIKCVVNYAIMQTVIGKSFMVQREINDEVPFQEFRTG